MLCSRFLQAPHGSQQHGVFYASPSGSSTRMLGLYELDAAEACCATGSLTLAVSLALLGASPAVLFRVMPKGFLPSEDTGQIFAITEAAQGISFEAMVEHQQAVADIVADDPNVDALHVERRGQRAQRHCNAGRVFPA